LTVTDARQKTSRCAHDRGAHDFGAKVDVRGGDDQVTWTCAKVRLQRDGELAAL